MIRLTAETRQRLVEALRAAERQTRAEFVMVIIRRADPYFFPPVALAATGALLLPGILWLTRITEDFVILYAAQLAVFALLLALLRLPAVLPHLIPASVGLARARRLARELFYRLGLHRTRERTGVLLFASLAERYIEIIADEGVDEAVPPGAWNDIVQRVTETAKAGGPAAGFDAGLSLLGETLGKVLPRRPDDRNEIADRLIEF